MFNGLTSAHNRAGRDTQVRVKEYRNFSIQASKINDAGQFYVQIRGLIPGGQPAVDERARRKYDPSCFRLDPDASTLLDMLLERPVKREHLFALGKVLGNLILPGKIRRRFLESLRIMGPDRRLRLRLILVDPKLAALPWEFMYVEDLAQTPEGLEGFLALRDDVSIVRHEWIDQPEPRIPRGGTYRMVAAFASPKSEPELNVRADRESIAKAIIGARGVSITPEWVDGATRNSLETALAKGCDVFHFSGHGYYNNGIGRILLEKNDGERSDPYEAEKLLQLLRDAKAKVAILGACDGGRRSDTNQWTGIAPVADMPADVPNEPEQGADY